MKKKRTVYNKIELFEASAVGVPSYIDAHLSFIKSLKEEKPKMKTIEKEAEEAVEEEKPEEEAPEEEAPAEEEEEEVEEEKKEEGEVAASATLTKAKKVKEELKKELEEIKKLKEELKGIVDEVKVKKKGLADTERPIKEEPVVKYEKGMDSGDFFQKWGQSAAKYFKVGGSE